MSLKKIVTLKGRVTELHVDLKVNKDGNQTWTTGCMLKDQKISFHTSNNTHIAKCHELIVSGTIEDKILHVYVYKNLSMHRYHYGHIFSSLFFFFIASLISIGIFIEGTNSIYHYLINTISLSDLLLKGFIDILMFFFMLIFTIESITTFIHSIRANIALWRFKEKS